MSRSAKEWSSPQNALAYLNISDSLPHRSEGESVLIEHLPEGTKRILDLGTGDGRLIRLIKANRSEIEAVAIDVSPTMLRSARDHFANDSKVKIIEHDLSQPLPDDLGYFLSYLVLRSIILDMNVSVNSTKKYMILLIQQEYSVI